MLTGRYPFSFPFSCSFFECFFLSISPFSFTDFYLSEQQNNKIFLSSPVSATTYLIPSNRMLFGITLLQNSISFSNLEKAAHPLLQLSSLSLLILATPVSLDTQQNGSFSPTYIPICRTRHRFLDAPNPTIPRIPTDRSADNRLITSIPRTTKRNGKEQETKTDETCPLV